MSKWYKFAQQANYDLNLGMSLPSGQEHVNILTPELSVIIEKASEKAVSGNEEKFFRYASASWLKSTREELFPEIPLQEVCAMFDLRFADIDNIERNLSINPHSRSQYAKNLLAWKEQAEKEKEAERQRAEEVVQALEKSRQESFHVNPNQEVQGPTLEQKIESLQGPAAKQTIHPNLNNDFETLRAYLQEMYQRSGHGFLAWFDRRVLRRDRLVSQYASGIKNGLYNFRRPMVDFLKRALPLCETQEQRDAIVREFKERDNVKTATTTQSPTAPDYSDLNAVAGMVKPLWKGDFLEEVSKRSGESLTTLRLGATITNPEGRARLMKVMLDMYAEATQQNAQPITASPAAPSEATPPSAYEANMGDTAEYLKIAVRAVLPRINESDVRKKIETFERTIAEMQDAKLSATAILEGIKNPVEKLSVQQAKQILDAVTRLGV